jgi:hypothetical protein
MLHRKPVRFWHTAYSVGIVHRTSILENMRSIAGAARDVSPAIRRLPYVGRLYGRHRSRWYPAGHVIFLIYVI